MNFFRNPVRWAAEHFLRYAVRMKMGSALFEQLQRAFHRTLATDHPKPLQAMRVNKSWLFAANRQIGGRGARAQRKLFINQHSIESNKTTKQQVFSHPFLDLVDNPNDDETGQSFHWRQLLQLNTIGRMYILFWPEVIRLPGPLHDVKLTKLKWMRLLSPDRVRPLRGLGPTGEGLRGFEYRPHGSGRKLVYPPAPSSPAAIDEWKRDPIPFIARGVMPAPDSEDGQSVAIAADSAINTNFALGQLHQNQLINGLHAGLIFYLLKEYADPDRFDKAIVMVKQGLGKAGEPLILPKKIAEVVKNPMSNQDMEFGDLHEVSRREILSVAGASDGVVGNVKDVNRANLEGLELGLAIGAVDPLNSIIADVYNTYILPLFRGQSMRTWLTMEFQTSALKNEIEEAKVLMALTGQKPVISQNEARGRIDLPPIAGGDSIEPKGSAVPLPRERSQMLLSDGTTAGVNLLRLLPKTHPLASDEGRAKKWRQLDAGRRTREQKLQEDLVLFWQRWGEEWAEFIEREGVGGTVLALASGSASVNGDRRRQDAFDFDEWQRMLREIHDPAYRDALVEAWNDQFREIGVSPEIVEADGMRIDEFVNRAGFGFATLTMQSQLQDIENVLRAADDEDDTGDVAEEVLAVFPSRDQPRRSGSQAATVVGGALSIGAWGAAERLLNTTPNEFGLMWLSMRDGKVRDSHVGADGQIVRAGEAFQVGGCLMRYPLDAELCGDAGEIINCRCLPVAVSL